LGPGLWALEQKRGFRRSFCEKRRLGWGGKTASSACQNGGRGGENLSGWAATDAKKGEALKKGCRSVC